MDGINFSDLSLTGRMRGLSRSASDTKAIGKSLGAYLTGGNVVCFFGDLGAGKTTFIKGLAASIAKVPEDEVHSPTYTYLNIYSGPTPVYHFDLYRLKSADDFMQMGFDEYFSTDEGICCVEWSERIEELLPDDVICVTIKNVSLEEREIEVVRRSFT